MQSVGRVVVDVVAVEEYEDNDDENDAFLQRRSNINTRNTTFCILRGIVVIPPFVLPAVFVVAKFGDVGVVVKEAFLLIADRRNGIDLLFEQGRVSYVFGCADLVIWKYCIGLDARSNVFVRHS